MKPGNSLEDTMLGTICREEREGVLYVVNGLLGVSFTPTPPNVQLQAMPLSVPSHSSYILNP
jgi:hypothetical protein